MTYPDFETEFHSLPMNQRVGMYNEYCMNYGNLDDMISDFDEDFFNTYFENPMEAARATFFGKIESWSDDYIKFNAYGNLVSLNEYRAMEEIECELESIFEHKDIWESYIESDEEEDDDDE